MSGDDARARPVSLGVRARGYLRFYPRQWRARYGEEFVAHLEAELAERPFSWRRSLNIALHGVSTRLRVERGLRAATRLATGAFVAGLVVVAILVSLDHYAGVPVTNESMGTSFVATPTRLSDVVFNFATPSRSVIQIARVLVVGLAGFDVPRVADVGLRHGVSSVDAMTGWPPVPLAGGGTWRPRFVTGLGRPVRLAGINSLVVGFRTPRVGAVYAIEGLRVTYLRSGLAHTLTLYQGAAVDVVCVSRDANAGALSSQCRRESAAASAVGAALTSPGPGTALQHRAQLATDAAGMFDFVVGRVATLAEMRSWDQRLNPSPRRWRLQDVTGAGARVLEYRYTQGTGEGVVARTACVTRTLIGAAGPSIADSRPVACARGLGMIAGPRR